MTLLQTIAKRPDPSPISTYLARLSSGSRPSQRSAIRQLAICLGADDTPSSIEYSCRWERITNSDVLALREILRQRYQPATANRMLAALRGVLKECWRQNRMTLDQLQRAIDVLPVPGRTKPVGRALTRDERYRLLTTTHVARDQTVIRVMIEAGLRRSEVAALRVDDVQTHPDVGPVLTVSGKGGKVRSVPITQSLYVALLEQRPQDYLQANTLDRILMPLFNISDSRVWQIVRAAAKRAGMSDITPHDLRRTFASTMLGAGVDLPTVQRMMGHSSPKTTVGYDRRGITDAAKAVNKVWSY